MPLSYAFDGAPTQTELEDVRERGRKALLAIRARWLAIAAVSLYGAITGSVYILTGQLDVILEIFSVPVGALISVVAYNAWYQYSYRRFAHIRYLNHAQIAFDICVVTVIVHFSGGAVSWFWTMYLLLTFEAALLLRRKRHTVYLGVWAAVLYGGLLLLEYRDVVPHVKMPFADPDLHHDPAFLFVIWGWVAAMNVASAAVASYIADIMRRREGKLRAMVVTDPLTGLYNRAHFFSRLRSEVERCQRYGRLVSVLVLDIDNFKSFNDEFGHMAGDDLLVAVADALRAGVRHGGKEADGADVDIPCRYGGEEFAVVLPEASTEASELVAERLRGRIQTSTAMVLAERIREEVARIQVGERAVTASIGVATYGLHGTTADELVMAADAAMYEAKQTGKNRTAVAVTGRTLQAPHQRGPVAITRTAG